jgi:hypothetical protein
MKVEISSSCTHNLHPAEACRMKVMSTQDEGYEYRMNSSILLPGSEK